MTQDESNEAVSVLTVMLTQLLGTLSGQTGRMGAALRYAIGDLQAGAATAVRAGALGAPLLNCFVLAVQAGATVDGMDRVRLAMLAQSPVGLPARYVAAAGVILSLNRMADILAATTFVSADAVKAMLSRVSDAFEAAEEFAADNRTPSVYQALIALNAAVVYDLTTRARPLPRLTRYSFAKVMTSHALANRLYGDAGRADELRQENSIIHPAFCPPTGVALSE